MPDFDPRAAITRLAAAGKECLGEPTTTEVYRGLWCRARSIGSDTQYSEWAKKCGGGCGGTGRIVPFAALRVSRHKVWEGCLSGCKGYLPEPNVRVACWELRKLGFEGMTEMLILRDAEAWMKEQP
jgi:hypothetical protein